MADAFEGMEHADRIVAVVKLVGNSGATGFQLRYSDDEKPTLWMAVATHGDHYSVGAGLTPWEAAFALAEKLTDGGTCLHCGKTTGVSDRFGDDRRMPFGGSVCWRQFDAEKEEFVPGCKT